MTKNHLHARRALLAGVAVTTMLGLSACGGVQGGGGETAADPDYPTETIEFIVPLAPGGSTDTLSRALAQQLSEELGQSVAVINQPGAGATVGLRELANAEADGYTIGMIPTSTLAVRPLSIEDADPLTTEDFTVIKGLTTEEVVLYTYAGSEFDGAQEASDFEGQTVQYASSGPGTVTGTAQALFFEAIGADATAVPFEGGAPAKTAVLGKQVPLGAGHPGEITAEVEAGTLVPLVVFSDQPSEFFPEIATSADLGVDINVDQRRLLGAPAGLPEDVRTKLEEATEAAVESSEYLDVLEQGAFTPLLQDGETAANEVNSSLEQYQQQVDELGINLAG